MVGYAGLTALSGLDTPLTAWYTSNSGSGGPQESKEDRVGTETEVHPFTVEYLCAAEIGLDIVGDTLQQEGKADEA